MLTASVTHLLRNIFANCTQLTENMQLENPNNQSCVLNRYNKKNWIQELTRWENIYSGVIDQLKNPRSKRKKNPGEFRTKILELFKLSTESVNVLLPITLTAHNCAHPPVSNTVNPGALKSDTPGQLHNLLIPPVLNNDVSLVSAPSGKS